MCRKGCVPEVCIHVCIDRTLEHTHTHRHAHLHVCVIHKLIYLDIRQNGQLSKPLCHTVILQDSALGLRREVCALASRHEIVAHALGNSKIDLSLALKGVKPGGATQVPDGRLLAII